MHKNVPAVYRVWTELVFYCFQCWSLYQMAFPTKIILWVWKIYVVKLTVNCCADILQYVVVVLKCQGAFLCFLGPIIERHIFWELMSRPIIPHSEINFSLDGSTVIQVLSLSLLHNVWISDLFSTRGAFLNALGPFLLTMLDW